MKVTEFNDLQSEFQLIDVREKFEFENEHLANSINIPMGSLNEESVTKSAGNKAPLFVCQSGARSGKVLVNIKNAFPEAQSLEGGLNEWKKYGFSLEGHGQGMSLERQVRIAAGFLVLIGIILMKLGFAGAEYLSAFVGAGLVFAGITDTCGMAIILAKMPWNNKN